jgi:DNA-binding GntR family transcriptional regulator
MDRMFDKASLSEQVEAALKNEILSGRLKPGQRINPRDLSAQWGISSTPLRDALRALDMQGFVTVEARKGIRVAPIDAEMVNEIFEVRIALECMAVEGAARQVPEAEAARVLKAYHEARTAVEAGDDSLVVKTDRMVHELARVHCGNRQLRKALDSAMELIRWAQRTIIRKVASARVIALPEHIRIMEAICARDSEDAARAMRAHIEASRKRLHEHFANGKSGSNQHRGSLT